MSEKIITETLRDLNTSTKKLLSEYETRNPTPQEAAAILALCAKLADLPGVTPAEE